MTDAVTLRKSSVISCRDAMMVQTLLLATMLSCAAATAALRGGAEAIVRARARARPLSVLWALV